MNSLIYIILFSILPVVELRGGIPLAIGMGFNVLEAFLVCTIANILIIPVIFFFLDYLHKYFMRIKIYQKLFDRYLKSIQDRNSNLKTPAEIRMYIIDYSNHEYSSVDEQIRALQDNGYNTFYIWNGVPRYDVNKYSWKKINN